MSLIVPLSTMQLYLKIIFLLLQHFTGIQSGEPVIFNRQLTGTSFVPFVWADDVPMALSKSTYSVKNIRTMLEVISRRFSKVLVYTVGVNDDVSYKKNHTYYHGADVIARGAETAAYINRERSYLSISVTIGVVKWKDPKILNTEMHVAIEAYQKAESIFPGTVEGLTMWNGESLTAIETTEELLRTIKTLRKMSASQNIRIGFQQRCDKSLQRFILRSDSHEFFKLKKEVLFNSDFVLCSLSPDRAILEDNGFKPGFDAIKSQVLKQREDIKSIDSNIEVMWHTWLDKQHKPRANDTKYLNVLRDYWIQVDEFATQHDYAAWLYPTIGFTDGFMGWWTLRNQYWINNASGYVEPVSDSPILDTPNEDNVLVTTPTIPEHKYNFPIVKTVNASNMTILDVTGINDTQNRQERVGTTMFEELINPIFFSFNEIIIGVISSTSILSWVIYLICKKIKRNRSSRNYILTRKEINEFRHGISNNDYDQNCEEYFVNTTAFKQPYNKLLEIPADKLEILSNQMLGGGEFGRVYKGLVKGDSESGMEVAVKTAKPDSGANVVRGLLSEIKILSYLGQHPNIVPILGAYTADISRGTVYIATELCPLGSLKACLKNCRDSTKNLDISTVPMSDMIRWSFEIASGMEYLDQKGVIHADLAARNVLLSSESVAKITDFGLSRRLYEYTNYTKTSHEPLPWRWMAVESLKMMEFSTKSDVWSYGVTLWEIFSLGSQPYPGLMWTVDFVESLEEGLRLKQPRYVPTHIFQIMEKCWNLDSDSRPSFTELKAFLTSNFQTNAVEESYTSLVA